MKLLLCAFALAVCPAIAQDPNLKHVTVPAFEGNRGATITALSIEREVDSPAVYHLKGSVTIKVPVCLPVGKNRALVCDGYRLLTADEADFHSDTGEVSARGNVHLSPLLHEK